MREIVLSGALAKQFGRRFFLDVKTPAEAVRALMAVVPGFRAHLCCAAQAGAEYQVFVDGVDIDAEALHRPVTKKIRIAPVLRGAKKAGAGQTIVGAVLIAVGAVAQFGFGQPWGTALMKMGAAIAIGGVVQMLSGTTEPPESDQETSYLFSGVVNTTAQGNPVPVAYGEVLTGSAVASAGVVTEDQSYVPVMSNASAYFYSNRDPHIVHCSWNYPSYSSAVVLYMAGPDEGGWTEVGRTSDASLDLDTREGRFGLLNTSLVRFVALSKSGAAGKPLDVAVVSEVYEEPDSNVGEDGTPGGEYTGEASQSCSSTVTDENGSQTVTTGWDDGTVTTTTTDSDGSITGTTTSPDGSTETTSIGTDGTSTTTTTDADGNTTTTTTDAEGNTTSDTSNTSNDWGGWGDEGNDGSSWGDDSSGSDDGGDDGGNGGNSDEGGSDPGGDF